jgi:hypothetical protein
MFSTITKFLVSLLVIITSLLSLNTQAQTTQFFPGDILRQDNNNSYVYCEYQNRYWNECYSQKKYTLVARPVKTDAQFTNNSCGLAKYSTVQMRSDRSEVVNMLRKFGYEADITNHYTIFGCSNKFPIINLNYKDPFGYKQYIALRPEYLRSSGQKAKCEWFSGKYSPSYCQTNYNNYYSPAYNTNWYNYNYQTRPTYIRYQFR